MARPFMAFPEWMPDRPRYQGAVQTAQNVYPKSRGGDGSVTYGPWPAPVVLSTALGARCQGAFAGRSSAGNVTVFAGDATKLYRLGSDAAWSDVSSTTYSTPADEHWEFCQFGEVVIATNFADPLEAWTLDTSAVFANLAGSPPRGRHIAVVEPGFVMLGNLDVSGTVYPGGLQWCAYNAPTDWPTPGTSDAASKQSDRSILPFGGYVNRIIGPVGGAAGAVFCDSAIFRIEYAGPPVIFRFVPVVQARGSIAPHSVVPVAISNSQTVAFFVSEDGFYAFDGTTAQPIGAGKFDKYALALFARADQHRIYGLQDPTNKLVLWQLPTEGGNGATILAYNWETRAASVIEPTQMASKPGEFACLLLSLGYTMDALDTLGYTLDALPFNLDSRVWTGGAPSLGYFDSDHKLNYFTGANLAAVIDSGQFDGGNGRRLFCSGIRLITDAATVSDLSAQIAYTDTPNQSGTLTTATAPGADGVCPQRISARYMSARAKAAAGATWTHYQGIEPTIRPEGMR